MHNQPIDSCHWVNRELLKANDYNPNKVPRIEFELLATSIKEDGWTQPIVVTPEYEIIDGFHRWTVSGLDEIGPMTDYQVPVVIRQGATLEDRKISTIRHNRARGAHYVEQMARLIHEMREVLPDEEIARRLGMEQEEIERLSQFGNMAERGSKDELSKGWIPNSGHDYV